MNPISGLVLMQSFGPVKFYFHFLFFFFGFLEPKRTFWPHWTGVFAEMVGTFFLDVGLSS